MKGFKFIGLTWVCAFCLFVLVGVPLSMAETPQAKMKPCEVKVVNMENIFLGKESISLAPYFEIFNPNNFPIVVSQFAYQINLKDLLCDGKNLPLNYYIPAKSKITFSSAFALAWANMAMWVWQTRGVSMAEATQEILPLWKNLNGQLFEPKMKEAWDKIPAESPQFIAKGQIDIVGPKKQTLSSDYSTTWKLSSEYGLYK